MKKRFVTGEENIFFMSPEANVSIVARIRGKIEKDILKLSIKKSAEKYPMIGAVITLEEDLKFLIKDDFTLPIQIINKTSDDQWMEIIKEESKKPFNFENGPLIRFIWLKDEDESDIIIFCQHMICDGKSLVNLIHSMLSFMGNNDLGYNIDNCEHYLSKDSQKLLRKNLSRNLLKRVMIRHINKKWKKSNINFNYDDFLIAHSIYNKKYSYTIISNEFSEEDTKNLILKSRLYGATVNSAIAVAYLAARKYILINYQNSIQGIGVNIRGFFDNSAKDAFGCFVSDITFSFEYDEKKDFWENVVIYHAISREKLRKNEDLTSYIAIENMDKALMNGLTFARHVHYNPQEFKKHKKFMKLINSIAGKIAKDGIDSYPGLLITNIGSAVFQNHFGNLILDKLFFAPSSIPLENAGMILGAVIMNSKLNITLNMTELNDGDGTVFKLMSKINGKAVEYLNFAMH